MIRYTGRNSKNNKYGNKVTQHVRDNDPYRKVYWNARDKAQRKKAKRKSAKRQKNLEYLIYTAILAGAIYTMLTY